jgi:hypothetical protein
LVKIHLPRTFNTADRCMFRSCLRNIPCHVRKSLPWWMTSTISDHCYSINGSCTPLTPYSWQYFQWANCSEPSVAIQTVNALPSALFFRAHLAIRTSETRARQCLLSARGKRYDAGVDCHRLVANKQPYLGPPGPSPSRGKEVTLVFCEQLDTRSLELLRMGRHAEEKQIFICACKLEFFAPRLAICQWCRDYASLLRGGIHRRSKHVRESNFFEGLAKYHDLKNCGPATTRPYTASVVEVPDVCPVIGIRLPLSSGPWPIGMGNDQRRNVCGTMSSPFCCFCGN